MAETDVGYAAGDTVLPWGSGKFTGNHDSVALEDVLASLRTTASPTPSDGGLQPGDIVTLRFAASDNFHIRAHQAAEIEHRLEKHKEDFYVHSANYYEKGVLIFKIRIVDDPSRLWTEVKIARLISECNPKGYYLAFKESVKETAKDIGQAVKETVKPGLDMVAYVGLFILAVLVAWEFIR